MNPKTRAWLLVLSVAVLCGAVTGGLVWRRNRQLTDAALLRRLPVGDSLVVGIDLARLRAAGLGQLLDNSRVDEDADYQAFVRKTDFNWQQDLDSAVVAFSPTARYLLVRGRFDWKSLDRYVFAQGGECYNSFCNMTGSAKDREISFFPIQPALMGMAVSPDSSAALRLQTVSTGPAVSVPDAPVWLWAPVSVLQGSQSLPDGTRMFARGLGQAQNLMLGFGPEGQRFAVNMTVECRNEPDAADVALELNRVTKLVAEMIAREGQKPNPADLSGVLAGGSFHPEGRRVLGHWPVERVFVSNLLGAQ